MPEWRILWRSRQPRPSRLSRNTFRAVFDGGLVWLDTSPLGVTFARATETELMRFNINTYKVNQWLAQYQSPKRRVA